MPRTSIQDSNASLYFNGTSGYMTSPVVPDITGFSFGVWIKTAVRADSTEHYMSWNTAGFTDGFALIKTSAQIGSVQLQLYNGVTVKAGILAADQRNWMHIACTYVPDGTAKIYLNGVLASSAAVTGSITAATAQTLTFGKRSYIASYSRYNMSNLVWHNTTTPWTQEQVTALYQNGTIPTGATAVYPLSEGAGSIAYDTSGNGNDGTITSGTWTRDTPTKTRKAVGGNMVFNGDFEIAPVVNVATTTGGKWIDGTAGGSDIMIFGWAYYNWATSYAVKFDTSTSHSGSASLKLSTTNTASTVGVQINAQTASTHRANNIPMLPSTSYTFSCWVKTNVVSGAATTGARVQFMTRTGDGITNVTTTTLATNLLTTQDWTQYTATFTTGATVRFGTPSFQIVGNDGAGTLIMDAWFDDITLTKTTPETRTAAGTRTVATSRTVA